MWESLLEVPWNTLTTRTGDAGEVPNWLCDLKSRSATRRQWAREALAGALSPRQAPMPTASAETIPFLWDLVHRRRYPDRLEICLLLADFLHSAIFVRSQANDPSSPDHSPSDAATDAVIDAIWAGWPLLLKTHRDLDREVRLWSALLLAHLFADAGDRLPPEAEALPAQAISHWIDRVRKGRSPLNQAHNLFALGTVAGQFPEARAEVERWLDAKDGVDPLLRYSAHLLWIDLTGSCRPDGVDLLKRGLLEPTFSDPLSDLPWQNGDVVPRIHRLGDEGLALFLPAVVETIRTVQDYDEDLAETALELVFGSDPRLTPWSPLELTPPQIDVLRAFAETACWWTTQSPLSYLMADLRLPEGRGQLRDFLAKAGVRIPEPSFDANSTREFFQQRLALEGVDDHWATAQGLDLRGVACDSLASGLADLPRLRELDLSEGWLTDAGLGLMPPLPCLRRLSLHGNPITSQGLAALERCPQLRYLDLSATKIDDAGLVHVGRLTHLRELNLHDTHLFGVGLSHLEPLANLRVVNLARAELDEAAFASLGMLVNLRELTLNEIVWNGRGLRFLRGLIHLRRLMLAHWTTAERGLEEIPAFPNLHSLDLQASNVTDGMVESIVRASSLRCLFLDENPITDVGVARLSELPLHELTLRRTAITDAGVASLSANPKLRQLDLRETKITGACVPSLLKLRRLAFLGLDETQIDPSTLHQLRRAFPSALFVS